MKNYPALFYAKEDKPIHIAGYTVALVMMGIGVLETIHSIPYIVKGQSNLIGMTLGPIGIVAGGLVAGAYLKEANVIYQGEKMSFIANSPFEIKTFNAGTFTPAAFPVSGASIKSKNFQKYWHMWKKGERRPCEMPFKEIGRAHV